MTRRALTAFALVSALGVFAAAMAQVPPAPAADLRWPIPAGWKHETFELPPGFAPEFPYKGSEDLRFMPGWSEPTASDWWSYAFVWWMDQPPSFDALSVEAALTTYFQGLAAAVGGEMYKFDPARFRTALKPVPNSNPPRLTGQIFTYDAFKTGGPIVLNVEAELRSCRAASKAAFVIVLSPKETTDAVWKALRDAAGALKCEVPVP
jgi:hypothetical protein